VADSSLVEYMMGRDIHIHIGNDKGEGERKIMVMDYQVNRRGQAQAVVKVIQTAGKDLGEEYKMQVSGGRHSIRGAIAGNYPGARTLEQLAQAVGTNHTNKASSNNVASKMAAVAGSMLDKIAGGGSQARRSEIMVNGRAESAFVAAKGMDMAHALCSEMGMQAAVQTSAPKHYADARKRQDCQRWRTAEMVEIKNCFDNGAFKICDEGEVPEKTKVMRCVFSYKVKTDSEGNETQCKARLNIDGRNQCETTYSETFAPTSRFTNVRTICAIAAQENMQLFQFDVKSAFLIPECKEDIFVQLPGEYRLPQGKVLRCLKYQYGLKNSALAWNEHLNAWMARHGYSNVDGDCVTFMKSVRKEDGTSSKIIIGMHVDDGIVATNDVKMYDQLIAELQEDFKLSSYGKLEWYLGCKIEQDLDKGTVTITQGKYARDVLARFHMAEAKPVSTPSEPGQHLRGDDCPPRGSANPEVIRNYQACIGSLMYLAVMTRGDCAYAVNQCARFLSNPGASHVAAAKRIMRYVAGTADQGIVYRRSEDPRVANVLTASADADHGGADDRRSVSGWVVMLNGAMVSWASKRQPVTAISSTESEFYSVSQCAMECVYLRRVMSLLGYEQTGPTLIAQDNYACICLTQGAKMYHKAKHIDTRVYRVRELASGSSPQVKLWKIDGQHQPSDLLTKALPKEAFTRHRCTIMGWRQQMDHGAHHRRME
jgi:hypothetical protein